jgi:acyl-CoA synthetase (NDP forming)
VTAVIDARLDWTDAAFAPRSIAIIGASDNPEKIGGRPIKYMLQHGFKGRIYAINPQRDEVQGLKAWPDVGSLPETPDVAVICVPGEAAVQAVQTCAGMGVRLGVIIASGFGETGAEGRAAQDRMVAAARAHGMRLVGPNTQGIVNFSNGAIASFATLIGEVGVADGPVAIVSQSGAMSVVPYALLRAEGIGVRHAHATGNECDLTVADFAWAVAGDPQVRLILLYLESVPDPQALARAAARAAGRGIPVLALKAGVSVRGQAAASSHTGAIATEDKVLDAFFRQNGIVRVPDMRSLVRSARLWLQAGSATGNRVTAISNSGACCVMAADAAERHGLDMQPFPPATRAALDAVLPGFASSANPVDLTAALLGNSGLFGQVLPLIAQGDAADAYFISLPMSGKGYDVERFANDAAAFRESTGKPTVVASPLASTRKVFEAAGVVSFEHDEDAMAALGELMQGRERAAEARRLAAVPHGHSHAQQLPARSGFLSEYESLALVEGIDIPVVPHSLCTTPQQLKAALGRLPAPWAIKACSAEIPHKTEYGLVRLGVRTEADALAAFDGIYEACVKLGKTLDGVLVAPMLRAQRELILGARWDERFGAVVMVGDGGKYVEAMPDVATAIYPFDAEHLRQQLERLRMAPLWAGVRGEPPLPLQAITCAAVALGRWVHAEAGRVLSADVNPLMAGPGDTLCAVDALVELAPARR